MKRVLGSNDIAPIECINPKYNKYRIRYDFQPYYNEEGEEQGVSFLEAEVLHKPTIEEVKDIILGWKNEMIDEQILSGFKWNDIPVWLSAENQFNYKAAYDLAVQTGGMNLPIVFKFGTTEAPKYHTFSTLEELSSFYLSAMIYINDTLAAGWAEKDAIDWTPYAEALDNLNKE
jgi:hypothetical protein